MATNSVYYLASIFGIARASISKKSSGWTLHISLSVNDTDKYAGYLTQSGHKTKNQAIDSWDNMQSRIEVELHSLSLRQHAANGGDMG